MIVCATEGFEQAMGPAFSLAIAVTLAAVVASLLFAVTRFFLPARASAILAVLLTLSGGIGCVLGLLIQAPFVGDTLVTATSIITYLGVGLATGLAFASITLWSFLRLWKN